MNPLDHLDWIAIAIQFFWSMTLIWGSLRLRQLARELEAERAELRRWQRLARLARSQNSRWQ